MKRMRMVLAVGVLALVCSLAASAGPDPGWVRYYYDAQGELVGARGWDCESERISWGVITDDYYETDICVY